MAKIKIYGDIDSASIFFLNSTVDPKPMGTIVASLKSDEDRIVIHRNDRFESDGVTFRTLFRRLNPLRICNKEGEELVGQLGYTTQDVIDYVNEQSNLDANISGGDGSGTDLANKSICFSLDPTSTSILLDNGNHFGVNTIKAVANSGNIDIVSIDSNNSIVHFTNIEVGNACINGNVISGGLNDIINTLNELFTVGAFESIVISDPFSTMVADVNGVDIVSPTYIGNAIDPVGVDVFGASSSGSLNGYLSTETINQAGEYFTFDIRVEGVIGFGLVHSQASYDEGYYSGNATYANPANFGTYNSQHGGFQFSHWFHPTPNGSWTNYGANTSYSMRAGWSNFNGTTEQADWLAGNPIKVRVGLDANGFISIETLRNGTDWVPHVRTSYPSVEGVEYRLGIKMGDTNVRLNTLPKVHLLEPAAPTMYFRYIESPDNNFHYPLFATEEEANYFDLENGGTGTNTSNVYPDEPTFTTWYKPTNGHIHNGTAAPTSAMLFKGNPISWTEITSVTNADLVPSSFNSTTINVNELSSVNVQLHPADAPYTTSIVDTDNSGLSIDSNGIHLQGTAPEVTGDYNANPSDTYEIEVIRSNAYGSSSGTLTVVVTNLTAPITAISGFNHVSGSTAMIDADTMDDGSVVHINNTVADGKRFVIEKAYIETNILPNLTAANDMYIIGLSNQPEDFSTLELSDFDTAIVWEYETANSHTFKFYRDGSVVQNIVINSITNSFYDYAIEINGTSAWLIACNINSIMNEPSPADGGTFSYTHEATSIEDSAPVTIHMAALNTTGDISTDNIETITTPTAPTSLTNWSKALDFSGSEYAVHVNNSMFYQPLQMAGLANLVPGHSTQGYTANNSFSRPWATVVVLKPDGYSGNQMIWNQGEGNASGSDNIFVNVTASGNVNFGWGREGTGYNQCRVATGISSSSTWYAVYVAHSGERLGGNDATAANLADCFDIRIMSSADSFTSLSSNLSVAANWFSTGYRMDRTVAGDFTVGGRGAFNLYSYRGKVASMVVHCLKAGVLMPDANEIKLMITDPLKWEADYLIGNSYRRPFYSNSSTNYQKETSLGFKSNQMWLMGDGTPDAFPNINNEQRPNWLNYTYLVMNSMVSNDIENVSINGLS